jgi:hypothetical protein
VIEEHWYFDNFSIIKLLIKAFPSGLSDQMLLTGLRNVNII